MARLLTTVGVLLAASCFNVHSAFGKGRISCKDAKGNDVDWFVLYKLPKTKPTNRLFITLTGEEMLYYDSRSKKSVWTLLDGSIYHKKNNPVKETLDPIYRHDKQVAYVAYNDQLPAGFNGTRGGHTKGILMAGDKKQMGTAWLQHSVPRFVENVKNEYTYPASGRENGQLFFCVSLPLKSVNVIAKHLQVQQANVFLENAPTWAKYFPEFWNILNRKYERKLPLRVDFLKTTQGKLVLAIAKPPKWPRDIYTEEVGHQMNDSITVQSWRNGVGSAQTKYCTKRYSVTDVDAIGVRTVKGYAEFSTREDHSKWYVTRHQGIFCFSSLNRMLSQMKRGGEITCVIDVPLATLFKKSIAKQTWCGDEKSEK